MSFILLVLFCVWGSAEFHYSFKSALGFFGVPLCWSGVFSALWFLVIYVGHRILALLVRRIQNLVDINDHGHAL